MRARLLVVLLLASFVAFAGVATYVALRGTGPTQPGTVAIDVDRLGPGQVMPVQSSLPGQPKWSRRVFVVHLRGDRITAFLGRSTHLGCRLWFHGDSHFGEGLSTVRGIAFQDPCGGSTFALDGDCIGGPCPRGLDRYRVDVRDGTAEIDLNHLLEGAPRHN